MTKVIGVALEKGGVGKTTTAQHLGHALAIKGREVLLVDLDQQASLTSRYDIGELESTMADVLGVERSPSKELRDVVVRTYQPRLYLAPADGRLALTNERLATADDGAFVLKVILKDSPLPFDYVILDLPPGASKIMTAALVAADEVIVPVQLTPMGFEGFAAIDESIENARRLQNISGGVRLRYRAIVPTFHAENEVASRAFMASLESSEHPDYAGQPLPLSAPVPNTTAFVRASARYKVEMEDGVQRRARTIFEMPVHQPGDPTERGQAAYMQLAEMVDEYL